MAAATSGRAASTTVVVASIVFAGCVTQGDQISSSNVSDALTVDDSLARLAAAIGDLPCGASVGDGTSANMRVLARSSLDADGFAGSAELWLHGDRAYVARYGTGGFSAVDISDPLNPREVGVWDPEDADRGLDVKATTDGSAVVMAGDTGITIIDVRDPEKMTVEKKLTFSKKQAHMITVFRAGGSDYVAAAKGDGADLPIWGITGGPGAHGFEPVSSVRLTTTPRTTGQWNPEDLARTHDAFFFEDPLLRKPTLWVANVWDGIVALDVSDPASPREIARIPNVKPQYIHTVQTVVVEGMRITVSVSEVGVNSMRVFDTTDLSNPRQVAEWDVGLPHKPQHNLQVVPPYVYVAHYEYGTFVFSLADILQGAAKPVARIAAQGGGRPATSDPTVATLASTGIFDGTWDVGLRDGLVYTTNAGLNVAAFGCVTPGDAAQTSTG